MVALGYHLSSEEHGPEDLVGYAARAEEAGFEFALISDHFHPWTSRQGHSPFVWGVLGAIANATRRLRVGTGVTAPIIRVHPALVAHAAATASLLMPGRFFLGGAPASISTSTSSAIRGPRPAPGWTCWRRRCG